MLLKMDNQSNENVASCSIKAGLTFFKRSITDVNTQRIKFNMSKNLIRYLMQCHQNLKRLNIINTPLGVMSFSLYYLRVLINCLLLCQLTLSLESKNSEAFEEIYWGLLNDLIWGTCNLIQFFWWTFSHSTRLGFRGMQLEAICQLFDLMLLCIQHQKLMREYQEKMKTASLEERDELMNEWHYKQLYFIRSITHLLLITLVMGVVGFCLVSMPISPFTFSIGVIGSLVKIAIQEHEIKQLKQKNYPIKLSSSADWHTFWTSFILTPGSLFLFVLVSPVVSIPLILSMLILQHGLNYFSSQSNLLTEEVTREAEKAKPEDLVKKCYNLYMT